MNRLPPRARSLQPLAGAAVRKWPEQRYATERDGATQVTAATVGN